MVDANTKYQFFKSFGQKTLHALVTSGVNKGAVACGKSVAPGSWFESTRQQAHDRYRNHDGTPGVNLCRHCEMQLKRCVAEEQCR